MKKKLVASLAAAMVLGVAGTSFAATNPFSDVPAKHWSYDAVTKLAKAGIVDGYGDGTFKGDKVMSRYEMAQITAKAMAHSDKATAEQKAAIDKLSVEFASELEGLNVRVSKLEKNASNIKFTGEYRVRYDRVENTNHALKGYLELNGLAQVNEDWKVGIRWEDERNFNNESSLTDNRVTRAYVTGPIAGVQLTAGKFGEVSGTGLIFDDNLSGAKIEFGNMLKAKMLIANTDSNIADKKLSEIQLNYNFSKATSAVASFQKWDNKTANTNINVWDVGVTTALSPDFKLSGSYGKSNEATDNKAYVFGLNYKAADINTVGSYGMYVNYENMKGQLFGADNTFNIPASKKGYVLGASYVPAKNIKLGVRYMDYKDQATDIKDKAFRAQAEFFF